MIELMFELAGAAGFLAALFFWLADHDDIMHWLFFLLSSAIMYINAFRYGKDDNER